MAANRSVLSLVLLLSAVSIELRAQEYTIAFNTFAPRSTDIFVADGDGDNARALFVDPALDDNASFSADGEWVIFTSERGGSADIYRARVDGSHLERLVDHPAIDDQAVLSPDGKSLAFVSSRAGRADIWVLDLQTRRTRSVIAAPASAPPQYLHRRSTLTAPRARRLVYALAATVRPHAVPSTARAAQASAAA